MAATYSGVGAIWESANTSATSGTLNIPAGAVNDGLFAFVSTQGTQTPIGAPSGWESVGSVPQATTPGCVLEVWKRRSVSGDSAGTTEAISWSGGRGLLTIVVRITGGYDHDSQVITSTTTSSISNRTISGITADRDGIALYCLAMRLSGRTFTVDSGVPVEIWDYSGTNANLSFGGWYKAVSTGSVGSETLRASATGGPHAIGFVVLEDTGGGGVSLTAAHTLEAITTSSTAAATTTASATHSLEAITTSASINVGSTVEITAAHTLEAITSSATASAETTATAVHQLEAITSSAIAQTETSATAAHSLEAITTAATATTATTATAAHSLEAITSAATAAIETAIAATHSLDAITTSATIEIGDIVLIQAHHNLEAITSSATAATATTATANHSLEAIAASGEIAIATTATAAHQLEAITTSATIDVLSTVEIDAHHTLAAITSSAVAATATEAIAHHNLAAITTSASMAIVVACRIDSVSVTRQRIQASVSNSRIQINSITRNWRA